MIEINKHWFYAIATIFSLGVSENVYPTNVHAKANYLRRTENNVSTNSVAKQNSTNEISGVVGSVNYTIDNGTLTLSQGSIDRTNSSDNNPFNDPVYPWTNNNSINRVQINGDIQLKNDAPINFLAGLKNLKTISNLNLVDTSEATNMTEMFASDYTLTNLDLSNFDTRNVTAMYQMFSQCFSLTNIDVSGFNTRKLTDMTAIFQGCEDLKSIDLSNFDTSEVTTMHDVFEDCRSLTNVNLENFDTSKVTDMFDMFSGCISLKSVNLANFDTSNVQTTRGMFDDCSNIVKLDLSSFKTPKLTDTGGMFSNCIGLRSLDLSNFQTTQMKLDNTPYQSDLMFDNQDKDLSVLKIGRGISNFVLRSLPDNHNVNSVIPGTQKKATGSGWKAIGNGTESNPQGQTYLYSDFIRNPLVGTDHEPETFVWQQDAIPTDTYTLDVNKSQDLYQGESWDPTSAINSATRNGSDNKSNVTITDQDGKPFTKEAAAILKPGQYTIHYQNGTGGNAAKGTLTLTIKNDASLSVTKDKTLYVGQPFSDQDFRSEIQTAKDVDGTPLDKSKIDYQVKDSKGHLVQPDKLTSKVGKYIVIYTTGKLQDGVTHSDTMNVNVAKNKTTINLKKYPSLTIIANQKWEPEDDFDGATDINGNSVAFKDITVNATNSAGKTVNDLKDLYKNPGNYTVRYINGSAEKDLKLKVQTPSTPSTPTTPTTPTTPVTPNTPSTSSSSSSSSSTSSSSSSTPTSTSSSSSASNTSLPSYVAAKGTVVYSINKIGLYKSTKFSAANRSAGYTKKPRVYRPMFVVTGYKRAANGALRYRVRDVNHTSKTNGKTGYITASQKYVRPVYYATKHSTVTVINPRGVNAYRKANLTKKVRSYRQRAVLHVKRIVTHNLTTRYVLTNGDYITANRKLVNMGRHKQVKLVKTKRTLNRYSNVNFTKKNHAIAKNRTLKVYGYDYSHGNDVTKHGALRYRVAGGYITANTKYVRAYK